jgi:MoaA/NifB/PqqE/SkfB family radical SAM enzyme
MTTKDIEKYVGDASRLGIEWIWIGGGEPFLYIDNVKQIAVAATRAAVPDVYVVTNGYWAVNIEAATERLKSLSDAGVTILGLSIDAFHQEYIPLDCVRNVLKAARKIGFKRIEASGQFLASVDFDIVFNRMTEENLKLLEQEGYLDGVNVSRDILRLCGRASDLLTPYLPSKDEEGLKSTRCEPRWLPVESLEKLRAVEIDWQGNVMVCPGISIGNAKKASLQSILGSYDCHKHPIIRELTEKGPYGLLQLARSGGYESAEHGYADGCHMCYDARRHLLLDYAEYLRPASLY